MDIGFSVQTVVPEVEGAEPIVASHAVVTEGRVTLQPFAAWLKREEDGTIVPTEDPNEAFMFLSFLPGHQARRGEAGNLQLNIIGAKRKPTRRQRRGRGNQQTQPTSNKPTPLETFGLGAWFAVVKTGVAGIGQTEQLMYNILGKDPAVVDGVRTFQVSPPQLPREHERMVVRTISTVLPQFIGTPPTSGSLGVCIDIRPTVDAMRHAFPAHFGWTIIDSSGANTVESVSNIVLVSNGKDVERNRGEEQKKEETAGASAGGSLLDQLEAEAEAGIEAQLEEASVEVEQSAAPEEAVG